MHQLPNIISILRVFLIVPIAIQLHNEDWISAFFLILVAGLSDALDGFLARAFKWQSRLGSILDPLADKLLLVTLFVLFAYKNIIPNWLAVLVIGRDFVILFGALSYYKLKKNLDIKPLLSSKINTAVQIIFSVTLMYHLAFSELPQKLLEGLLVAVAITTLLSGFMYVICWTRYTIEHIKNNKQEQHNL